MKRYAYILIMLIATVCCQPQLPESPEMLVVEGWIENDAAPVVFVTSSVSATLDEKNISDLLGHVALNAQVTVTHNGQEYRLTPNLSDEHLLKICYTTNRLKGETGGIYQLKVDWKGMHAEAETTILPPGSIDSTTVERHPSIDTLYILKAHIVPVPEVRYYRFFSMASGKDSTYCASYIGTFDRRLYNDDMIAVNRGRTNPIIDNEFFYTLGDTVHFKLASMDINAYNYWRNFEENVMFSHVALLPYSTNLQGNIRGGLGYWFGYGTRTYETVIGQ